MGRAQCVSFVWCLVALLLLLVACVLGSLPLLSFFGFLSKSLLGIRVDDCLFSYAEHLLVHSCACVWCFVLVCSLAVCSLSETGRRARCLTSGWFVMFIALVGVHDQTTQAAIPAQQAASQQVNQDESNTSLSFRLLFARFVVCLLACLALLCSAQSELLKVGKKRSPQVFPALLLSGFVCLSEFTCWI